MRYSSAEQNPNGVGCGANIPWRWSSLKKRPRYRLPPSTLALICVLRILPDDDVAAFGAQLINIPIEARDYPSLVRNIEKAKPEDVRRARLLLIGRAAVLGGASGALDEDQAKCKR